jgi:hypothetical protein
MGTFTESNEMPPDELARVTRLYLDAQNKVARLVRILDMTQRHNQKLILETFGTPTLNKMMWIDVSKITK